MIKGRLLVVVEERRLHVDAAAQRRRQRGCSPAAGSGAVGPDGPGPAAGGSGGGTTASSRWSAGPTCAASRSAPPSPSSPSPSPPRCMKCGRAASVFYVRVRLRPPRRLRLAGPSAPPSLSPARPRRAGLEPPPPPHGDRSLGSAWGASAGPRRGLRLKRIAADRPRDTHAFDHEVTWHACI
jgi:hypothetical protein